MKTEEGSILATLRPRSSSFSFSKLVPEELGKEYLRELNEIAKGGTCCEQEEIIKRIESVLVVGFL